MSTLTFVDLPVRASVPRDGWDRPLVIPKGGGKPKAHTRTTTFIDCIEDKSSLVDWGKRMVLLGAGVDPSLAAAALLLDRDDKDDKRVLNALAEKAMDACGANDKREKGTYLHGLSEIVDEGQALPAGVAAGDMLDMAAYSLAMMDMTYTHIEKLVVVNHLAVAGTPDRVVHFEGTGPDGKPIKGHFIFDLKTGNVEYGRLKIAAQLAAYSRGEFYDFSLFPVDVEDKKAFAKWKKTEVPAEEAALAYTPIGGVNQEWGIVLHLPSGSGEAELYWVNLTTGWMACEMALTIRATRSLSGKSMRSFASVKKVEQEVETVNVV